VVERGQWCWGIVLQVGGVLTSGYLVLVLVHALRPADRPVRLRAPVSGFGGAAALGLALCSLGLGLLPWESYLAVPAGASSSGTVLAELWKVLWPLLAGAVLAMLLGRWGDAPRRGAIVAPLRRVVVSGGQAVERTDGLLRQWPVAGLSLLALALLFGGAMWTGR
jgi:hypothetical protein